MSNWKHTLDLTDLWSKYDDDEVTDHVEEIGKAVSERLSALAELFPILYKTKAKRLAESFKTASDLENFNRLMDRLYDLADTTLIDSWPATKLMWVETQGWNSMT